MVGGVIVNEHGKRLLDGIRADRGYVLTFHEELAERDPAFLGAYEQMYQSAMGDGSALPAKVRELLVMVLDLVLGVGDKAVRGHARRAMARGATEAEVLAAIEIATLVSAGKPIAAVAKVFGDEEPSA